jgi:hypothetical protein
MAHCGRSFTSPLGSAAVSRSRLIEITGWDGNAHRRIDAFDDIAELPSRLWLYVEHIRIVGRPNAEPEGSGGGIVWLSHHALSRLCQRCNARRPRDLIVATHARLCCLRSRDRQHSAAP